MVVARVHWTKSYVPTTLGIRWVCIRNILNPAKLAGFNTFPSAYPIGSQVVGMYVFVQWSKMTCETTFIHAQANNTERHNSTT